MISWGIGDLLDGWRANSGLRRALAAIPIALIAFITSRQLTYWQDSGTIWRHSLEATGDPAIERQLANALIKLGRFEEAVPHLFNAAKVDPEDAQTHANLGAYYSMHGRRADAIQEFETTVTLTTHPDLNSQDRLSRMSALLGLGFASMETGNFSDALTSFASAVHLDAPQVDDLIASLEKTVETQPSEPRFLQLGLLLRATGRDRESTSVMDEVVKSNPDFVRAQQLRDFLIGAGERQVKTRRGGEGGI
jgi:tetratricopeptide (TPR) repeat protein